MKPIIEELAQDARDEFISKGQAAISLMQLSDIPFSKCKELIEKAYDKIVRAEAIADTAAQNDMGVVYEQEYRWGAMR